MLPSPRRGDENSLKQAVHQASTGIHRMTAFPVILHVDMDAFFASVEQRDHPELQGKPVVVGASPERRGVVCAASYEARRFGIHSAMPSKAALKRCPQALFVPPDMQRYRRESNRIMDLLSSFADQMEQVSVDEAYLDLSLKCQSEDHDTSLRHALTQARAIKQRVLEECQLTISVGIAGNKLMAKIASDYDKPDGLILIPEADKVSFLAALPIRRLPGIGQVTEQTLRQAGIQHIAQLQRLATQIKGVSSNHLKQIQELAMGVDHRRVEQNEVIKSMSSETTFEEDTQDRQRISQCLREQAEELTGKLRQRNLHAQGIQVKVRYSDFKTLSRQTTLTDPTQEKELIYRTVCWLLAKEGLVSRPLRLIGTGLHAFSEQPHLQLALPFPPAP
jgi:DNA polymerase-4